MLFKPVTHLVVPTLLFGLLTAPVFAERPAAEEPVAENSEASSSTPTIQLAILLDTSGSMDGLINQARTQLWKIVNELSAATKDGEEVALQVALYEYGKQSLPAEEGYLRMIVPLTDDLDKLSEELFALKTNGGDEYCGWVIRSAVQGLKWSESDDDLKMIYVCGNEPFTQGSVDHKESCRAAIEKGIIVNTIFCGDEQQGIATGWKAGATLADGSFMHIDQNRAVAAVVTPFDKELTELSTQINGTFLYYADEKKRKEALARQVAQDEKAAEAAPAAAANRAQFKASTKYKTSAGVEIVTAVQNGKLDLGKADVKNLPAALQKMTPEQRAAHVKKLADERTKIQSRIAELSKKRNAFIAEERKKTADAAGESLDEALIESIQDQAEEKAYEFKGN